MTKRTNAAMVPSKTDDARLDKGESALLAEALLRAEEARDVMEDALVSFGRWLLVRVFHDDAAAALADRGDNPVWRELRARAGGPTLRLSERILYTALRIAAYDKRITDESWRSLEPGRKALLLPLGDDKLLRKAAQHVTAMKLSYPATQAYVNATRKLNGDAPKVRLTPRRLVDGLRRVRSRYTAAPLRRRVDRMLDELDDAERAAIAEELAALHAWSAELLRKVKGGR